MKETTMQPSPTCHTCKHPIMDADQAEYDAWDQRWYHLGACQAPLEQFLDRLEGLEKAVHLQPIPWETWAPPQA
jgi:hypothetical protein